MSILDSFRSKNCIYLLSKRTGQYIFALLTHFNVCKQKDSQKIWVKCTKSLKSWTFWDFCHFRCQCETFSFRILQLSFNKRLLDNHFFPEDPLKFSKPRSLPKLQFNRTFKLLDFLSKSVPIWDFSNLKAAINFSEKPTGQPILTLMIVFNILRSLAKNCIETLKLEIVVFLPFSVSIWDFFQLEYSNYLLGKAYGTTNSCHVERFQHSNPRRLSKIWQKLHKSVKNWKVLEFLSFLC